MCCFVNSWMDDICLSDFWVHHPENTVQTTIIIGKQGWGRQVIRPVTGWSVKDLFGLSFFQGVKCMKQKYYLRKAIILGSDRFEEQRPLKFYRRKRIDYQFCGTWPISVNCTSKEIWFGLSRQREPGHFGTNCYPWRFVVSDSVNLRVNWIGIRVAGCLIDITFQAFCMVILLKLEECR